MVWLLLVAESQSTEGWLFALPFIGVVFDLVAWHQLDSIGTNHPQYPMNRNARGSVMAAIHDVAAPGGKAILPLVKARRQLGYINPLLRRGADRENTASRRSC